MKLVTIQRPPAGRSGAIIADEVLDLALADTVVAVARWIPAALASVIAGGPEGIDIVRRVIGSVADAADSIKDDLRAQGALSPYAATRLLAPLPRPGILLSHARAYHSQVAEMKGRQTGEPIGFMKNVNAIIGHRAPIIVPAAAPDQLDFEAEISVVFGRACHGVSAAEAMQYVFGFTIVNDVSARDWVPQMRDKPDLNRMGKQFETFSPMGPCIATLDEIASPDNLNVRTWLNCEKMQDAWTRELIWSVPELIEYYGRWYPFQPGDVLTTGSPEGVGYGRDPKIFMRPGDTVSIEVSEVGRLENTVRGALAGRC